MNKLDIALYAVNEAKEKLETLKQYRKDKEVMDFLTLVVKYETIPTKQGILDNIKLARRTLSEARKEVEKL